MRNYCSAWRIVLPALLLAALSASATPQLEVRLGFAERFVPGTLTPICVKIAGVDTFTGFLVLTQKAGNPWRGEAISRVEIPLALAGGEKLERLIPIYDFTHPLAVSLLDQGEKVLAGVTIDLRSRMREEAFPLAVGVLPFPFADELVAIDEEALPRLWPAYEAVSSLWVGHTAKGLPEDSWNAIGRWVSAGGTLVLFTGEDFYLLDSPVLRALLPLANPRLSLGENGVQILRGEERPNVRTLLSREGDPLLLLRRYGAGAVYLVTTSAFNLEETDFKAIAAQITPARLIDLTYASADLLERTPLQRPAYLAAFLLVLACLISYSLVVLRAKSKKRMLVLLLAAGSILCLSSGFYTNRTKVVNSIYELKTSLYAQTSFGYVVDYYGLFATMDGTAEVKVRGQIPIIQELPRSLQQHSFDIDWVEGEGASLVLQRGERRYLRGFGAYQLPLAVVFTGDEEVRIENDLDEPLEEALLIVKGQAFSIGEVRPGEALYYLNNGVPLADAEMRKESFTSLLREFAERFCLADAVWLVGATEEEVRERYGTVRIKVRDIALYVVAGEEHE